MKTLKAISLLVLVTLFMESCDPAKILLIQADNKNNVSVSVYTDRKIIPFGDKNDSTKLIVHVSFHDTTSKTFNYGIGNWPDEAIKDLSANIDSIVINNTTHKVLLVNKVQIENYLKRHRSGYAGSILTIGAK